MFVQASISRVEDSEGFQTLLNEDPPVVELRFPAAIDVYESTAN
jgi:hypothetical protein